MLKRTIILLLVIFGFAPTDKVGAFSWGNFLVDGSEEPTRDNSKMYFNGMARFLEMLGRIEGRDIDNADSAFEFFGVVEQNFGNVSSNFTKFSASLEASGQRTNFETTDFSVFFDFDDAVNYFEGEFENFDSGLHEGNSRTVEGYVIPTDSYVAVAILGSAVSLVRTQMIIYLKKGDLEDVNALRGIFRSIEKLNSLGFAITRMLDSN